MIIKTKYDIGDAIKIGKGIFGIKKISIHVGLRLFRLDSKSVDVRYSVERPDCSDWFEIPEKVISGKAKKEEWIKAGGKFKERTR